MAKAEYKATGKCGVCGKQDEGIEVKVWWFIKIFICEGCWAKLFRQFKKAR